jgi:hypothetical protein
MVRLEGFPIKNQRTTVTSSGKPDVNAEFDCVPESLAAALQYFTGKNFEGGVLKEMAYGTNYRGGTAASAYVQICAHFGMRLYPIGGDPGALVTLAHQHIKANHAPLITEVDPYMPPGSGFTHVIILDEEHAGGVFAMDPFVAHEVGFTDASLAVHMAVREVWIAEKLGANSIVSISLTTPPVGNWFKAGSGNAWICSNGFTVHDGMLNFYRTMGGSLAGLTYAGLPTSNEHRPANAPPNHPEITEQDFERLTLRYDPAHAMDSPPGAGSVYVIHQAKAAAPAVDVSGLQAQLDAATKQGDAARIQNAGLVDKLQQIETLAKI